MATTVTKNKTADTGRYSYKYVDIAQIHELLEANGWSYYQYIDRLDGDDYVMTVKVIDGKELPPLRGARIVDATLNGVKNPAQEQGSAITYARRYSLLLAFGLATVDDDAQSLSTEDSRIDAKAANDLIAKCERCGVSPEKLAALYKVKNLYFLNPTMLHNILENWAKVEVRCAQ